MAPRTRAQRRQFLNLPAEIRAYIYHELFQGVQYREKSPCHNDVPDPVLFTDGLFRNYTNTEPQIVKENPMTVLSICRQIRQEALPVFYHHLLLVFPISMRLTRSFLRREKSEILQHVRHVRLDLQTVYYTYRSCTWHPRRQDLFRILPSLETLILDMSSTHSIVKITEVFGRPVSSLRSGKGPLISRHQRVRHDDERIEAEYVEWIVEMRAQKPKFRILCLFEPKQCSVGDWKAVFVDLMTGKDVRFEIEAAAWEAAPFGNMLAV